MKEGIKITVEDSKCIQCSAYIPSDCFSLYHLNTNNCDENEIRFMLNLNIFTECLNMLPLGEDFCTLKMYFKNERSPLILM